MQSCFARAKNVMQHASKSQQNVQQTATKLNYDEIDY
jgi:hypothetical protein